MKSYDRDMTSRQLQLAPRFVRTVSSVLAIDVEGKCGGYGQTTFEASHGRGGLRGLLADASAEPSADDSKERLFIYGIS